MSSPPGDPGVCVQPWGMVTERLRDGPSLSGWSNTHCTGGENQGPVRNQGQSRVRTRSPNSMPRGEVGSGGRPWSRPATPPLFPGAARATLRGAPVGAPFAGHHPASAEHLPTLASAGLGRSRCTELAPEFLVQKGSPKAVVMMRPCFCRTGGRQLDLDRATGAVFPGYSRHASLGLAVVGWVGWKEEPRAGGKG